MREPERPQRLADHAAEAGDDARVVADDAREVVLERTQPRAQGGRPLPRQRGHLGARDTADVTAHGAGQRAEPRFLGELGHRVDRAAHLALGAGPFPGRVREGGAGRRHGLDGGGDVPGERDDVVGVPIGAVAHDRAVQAAHDVPEALGGCRHGGPLALRVARAAGSAGHDVLGGAAVLLGALDPLLPVLRARRLAVGRHCSRGRGEARELLAGQRRRRRRLLSPVGGAGEVATGLVGRGAPGRGVGGIGRVQEGLGRRAGRGGQRVDEGLSGAGVPLGASQLRRQVRAHLGGCIRGARLRVGTPQYTERHGRGGLGAS